MHIIFVDKIITLENIVSNINIVNIDDNINYLNREDGVLIKGFLDLECQYNTLGILKEFKDKVEINVFIQKENIGDNLNLKLEDFDYFILENKISFSFKLNIEGYKEIDKSFQDKTQEMEIVSNIDVTINDIKEYMNNDNTLIVLDNFNKYNEINFKEDNNIILNDDEDIKELKETINIEGERLLFNINGNIDNKDNNKHSISSLFKKDKKLKLYKYRVVLENDTYEEIAKECNVNLYKLKEINKNIPLINGNIIKIPFKK